MFGGPSNDLNTTAQHALFVNRGERRGERTPANPSRAKLDSSISTRRTLDYAGPSARATAVCVEWDEVSSTAKFSVDEQSVLTKKAFPGAQ